MSDNAAFPTAITMFCILVLAPFILLFVANTAHNQGYEEATKELQTYAVVAGVAEYYIDENKEKAFRWLPQHEEQQDGD